MEELTLNISEKNIIEFSEFLYKRENSEATIRKYTADVTRFLAYLEKDKTISKNKLLDYKKYLVSKYAVRSVNSVLAAINCFLSFLNADCLKLRKIKMQQELFLPEEKELTKKEFQRLVREARRSKKEWLALVMETIAATGIRISELKFFTVEHVKNGKIEIYNKGKYRKIFIPKVVQKQLLHFAQEQRIKKGIIFVSGTGKPKDRSVIWKEMKRLKEKTGIAGEKIFPHNLRHLFARIYYQCTKDITGLADLLGHSSLNVTRIYTANTGETYRKQLNQMQMLEE